MVVKKYYPQIQVLEELKALLKPHESMAAVLADLFHIHADAAYRRIRGEVQLTFQELSLLAGYFGVSPDRLFADLHTGREYVTFRNSRIAFDEEDIAGILNKLSAWLDPAGKKDTQVVVLLSQDLPMFYYFLYPELARFYLYLYFLTIRRSTQSGWTCFEQVTVGDTILRQGRELADRYFSLSVCEIWQRHSLNRLVSGIAYCSDLLLFRDQSTAGRLVDQLAEMMGLLIRQAEWGVRVEGGNIGTGRFTMMESHQALSEPLMYLENTYHKSVCQFVGGMNPMVSTDKHYCGSVGQFIHAQQQQATQLSSGSELERQRFFRVMGKKIQALRDKII